jgi:hypothetical protein
MVGSVMFRVPEELYRAGEMLRRVEALRNKN